MAEPLGLDNGLTNYGDRDFARYLRRSMAHSMGISGELLSKPVIGIAASPSDFNNCHRYMPQLVEAVSRGVLAAGGLPRMFPTVSLGEVFLNPTSMVYRNLMSMDVEEMVRAQPMDAVVLIGGCDKTVPAQLMGAASANLPAIQLVTGPMSTGRHKGERLGACTDCRRFWGKFRAGEIDQQEIRMVETRLATTAGTCAVMGTASTMACIAETLGMSLPGTAAIPAVDSQRLVAAEETGKAAVRLAHSPILPSQIMTEQSVENAFRILMALGGSTNAIIHLTAVAGRLGIRISPERLNEISDETPVLVDLKPVGEGYMEDFHAAGGMGAVLRELRPLLNLDCLTVDGRTLRERLDEPAGWVDRKVIRSFSDPVSDVGGLIALHGSLAPDGAIFKRAAATPALFEKEGRAVVFEGLEDLANRIDSPDLDVTADDILVLKNAGPLAAGMPEAGYLPIPSKLAKAGVKDMVRISDARMSGTAYGTIVLHVSPEAAAGGPLEAVRNGDRIRLSVSQKSIDLLVEPEEIARRLGERKPLPQKRGGYQELYQRTVLQAPEGCDLDFLAQPRS
ncbi:dihydroxy-acid dehydratase IlvD (plasmid) [Cupriavidus necator N-1]|uniref:Dihydroxy-acid dehydratase IlvD n=1 Tax=Cupriavidus necator (strain ATCC 43291 / DSM 13513 / CCUG 52238 / LMG 8453 / N-1) TaxID=1042878 RepID=F8GUP7_CUPNN|nr:IlvD/Edd family dehydratase [Cupriavidus necator]AEI82451.1 dihydroxy-acid dehydratase IlvD [Cupriavidus necator N-1]MDX6007457.1 IlvD/Edd family dehydratase [Cupriavidus necator]